jgi:hypothetical protein
LVQQQPVVLTNPVQHGKISTQASPSTEGGSQGPPPSSSNSSSTNMYMMKGVFYISTRVHDYKIPITSEKSKEVENPPFPLEIEKTLVKTMIASQKVRSRNLLTIQTQGPHRTTLWWRICLKPLVRCLLWRSSRANLPRERLYYPP